LMHAEMGRGVEAERAARSAIDESDEPGFKEHFVLTIAHLALTEVLRRRGRLEHAEHAAARAVELSRSGAGRLERALALLALADARQATGDRAGASEPAAESAELFASCPDPGVVGKRALDSAHHPLSRPRRGSDSALREELSDRELAVLRLLPTPLSQREIGGELYVSLNTVKSHMRSIHRKLGTATREETVTRARDLGLV
jgi:LuxR family transcriptional regulator, maltose regulon positive regulatory protein